MMKLGHLGNGRSNLAMDDQVGDRVDVRRFAIDDYQASAVAFRYFRESGSWVNDK